MQEIFIKTLHFPKDQSLHLEKKYSKFIKDFSKVLISGETSEIKSKLYSPDLKTLFQEVQNFLKPSEDSWVQHLEGLFRFIGVSLVEIGDNFRSEAWKVPEELFTIHLYERSDEVFFLVSKDPVRLPKPQESILEPDSPLLTLKPEESDNLEVPGSNNDSLIDQAGSDEESDWNSIQNVLNDKKKPVLTRVQLNDNSIPVNSLNNLDLPVSEKVKYSSAIPLNHSKFLTSLTLTVVNLFTSQNLFHISLQIITNTLYHFPFTHSRSFEQKHLKLTQELLKAFNSQDSQTVQTLLNSSEIQSIFEEIEENIEKSEESLIFPVFSLIRLWKIALVEKQGEKEYIWNVNRPFARFVLYLFNERVYLLAPVGKFAVKGIKAKDEDLGKEEDDEKIDLLKDDKNLLEDDLDVLDDLQDLLVSTDVDDETLEAHGRLSISPKNVKFKPELTIDIERAKGTESPSPTYRSALKKPTNLSPDIQKTSPVLKYFESAQKYKNPVERYVARARNAKE
jgi:hypothetical protein